MKRVVSLLICVLFPALLSYAGPRRSLESDALNWRLAPATESDSAVAISSSGFDDSSWIPAVVPGTVFTSYVEAGLEKSPEFGDNIYKVDETFYNRPFWYRAHLNIPARASSGSRVLLHFMNINRYADFWFNGHKISGTESSSRDVSGHMLRSVFDVTPYLKAGDNIIAVKIYDPDQKKTRTAMDPYGVACSPSYLAGAGWDWIPYIPGRLSGITGHAYMEYCGAVTMEDPWIRSELSSDYRTARLYLRTKLVNASSSAQTVKLNGSISLRGDKRAVARFSAEVRLAGGESREITIGPESNRALLLKNPQLWWPNGYGEQPLYTCSLDCSCGGNASQSETINFGIRKYEYDFVKNVKDTTVLNFRVNGKKVFIKGGNWGMSDFLLRSHGDDYRLRIILHRDMNYNMIRLWTGCVTDDEFYDYCDRYGIMVWDDFWLYVAYNDVAEPESFIENARDKVRRLRNHPCIALWCGANECSPAPALDKALREIVAKEDHGDRLYKSCSNQNALSGSGWWKNMTPRHHFSTSASNLAFNKPPYAYGVNFGYGMRSEIGTATFPSYESVCEFIPEDQRWPLPDDEALKNDNDNVWNCHFFGRSASNAAPGDYLRGVNGEFGESSSLEEFCTKAQLLNLEVMQGMYEAWNDKMWDDAAGILVWMSHPAYPAFVWQTYDYYMDMTGAYWGAKKACEHRHVQWNCLSGSVKVVNNTLEPLRSVKVRARVYDINGTELSSTDGVLADVQPSSVAEAFVLPLSGEGMRFIRLEMHAQNGLLITDNFYWYNPSSPYDYRALAGIPKAELTVMRMPAVGGGEDVMITNSSQTPAVGIRLRYTDASGNRVLPILYTENYLSLMPGETRRVRVLARGSLSGCDLMVKQYLYGEQVVK